MKVAIAGTGALACLFGLRLSPYADVTLIGTWPEAIRAIRAHGIRMDRDGGVNAARIHASSNPEDAAGADLLIVLVKSPHTGSAVKRCAAILRPDGLALTLQNGLGNREILEGVFGAERTAAGVTAMGAYVVGPGCIRHGGDGETRLERHPRIQAVADLFIAAQLQVAVSDDLRSLQWGKLAVSSGLNPLTALFGVENGRLTEYAPLKEMYLETVRETAGIATALGVRLPFPDAEFHALNVAMRTAGNRSSMFQDLSRGVETEIDAISGAVVRTAQSLGVPSPMNGWLHRMIRIRESIAGEGGAS